MVKKIPSKDLQVGMYIVDVDRRWVEKPVFDLGIVLKTQEEVENFKRLFKYVWIDTEKSKVVPRVVEEKEEDEKGPRIEEVVQEDPVEFEEELEKAKVVYQEAKKVVKDVLSSARFGEALKVEGVRRVAEGVVESVLRNARALASLSRLKSYDEYTFQHSVNVGVLAVSLGRRVGLGEEDLYKLSFGALLHDIGKMKIPDKILNKPGKLTPEEFEVMKKHTILGFKILANQKGVDEREILPPLEHHERVSGEGYPFGKRDGDISLFGRICAIVDVYDAITSDRVYHKGLTPYEALSRMYSWVDRDFDKKLFEIFVKTVGIYPVGSVVVLSNGMIGIVEKQNPNLLKPVVKVVKVKGNFIKPFSLDLEKEDISIKKAIDGKEEHIDPNLFLEGEGR